MAAGIVEPDGKAAGRVTITGAFVSLIPPFATILVVVIVFLVGIISAEVAAAVILGILVNAGLTTSTVFTVQKHTPTDQKTVVWGTAPVSDVVTPPQAPVVAEPRAAPESSAKTAPSPETDTTIEVTRRSSLAAEVDAVRARRTGSTMGGVA